MSRIPIASLANGVLFATQTFASPSNPSGVPVLTPAVGTQCFVYVHDTATPAAIWTDELGSVPLAQPLTTNASGTVPGWIDTSLLPLDLIVALPSGNETFVLAGAGGSGGGGAVGSVFGRTGSITAQTGDYTAAQVGADAAGAAAAEQSRAQTAEALLAPKASPALTGTPTVPTAAPLTNSTQASSTAYSDAAVAVEKTRALAAEAAKTTTLLFTRPGNLAVESGTTRLPIASAQRIVSVTAVVNTAPTGASIIVDILKNGTTIFTTTANRPTIAASANISGAAVPDITSLSVSDYLQIQIVQVGSVITGADMTVAVLVQ